MPTTSYYVVARWLLPPDLGPAITYLPPRVGSFLRRRRPCAHAFASGLVPPKPASTSSLTWPDPILFPRSGNRRGDADVHGGRRPKKLEMDPAAPSRPVADPGQPWSLASRIQRIWFFRAPPLGP
ncbi:uncharacterized protein [Triticum aestivum]|uniref:uncharacterized protein n=1 Tax=Triticum aestivum TaxID=4565 RepID=UPI001D01F229|nr:uncharacterized protein LOC123167040 [Triticum aestivum]